MFVTKSGRGFASHAIIAFIIAMHITAHRQYAQPGAPLSGHQGPSPLDLDFVPCVLSTPAYKPLPGSNLGIP